MSGVSIAGEVYGVPSIAMVVNNLLTASGALRNDVETVSGITTAGEVFGVPSGTINVKNIATTSGTLRRDVTSASGAAAAQSFTPSVNVPATTKPLEYNYSGTAIATQNVVVSSGFLTLPIFSNSSDLPPAISGFRGRMAICQFGTDDMSLVFCARFVVWNRLQLQYKPIDSSGSRVGGYKPI